MSKPHPQDVLYNEGDKRFPALAACVHYAGNAKLIGKSMALQAEMGPIFDITCDCEDGAAAGREHDHAVMVAEHIKSPENRFNRMGTRIHDVTHPHWKEDLEIIVGSAGERLAYIVLPKAERAADVRTQIDEINRVRAKYDIKRSIPAHVLIETHGALREIWDITAIPEVESVDFGIMDFISAHHGAIPGAAMASPGQFAHPLLVRAKAEIVSAALAHNVVPAHNVTTEIQDLQMVGDDAERACRHFGFLRMWSIHPNQIRPIVEAMQPDYSEIDTAAAIITAAQDADWGPIQHAGKLHDRASFRYYWELLQRAHATGMELSPATNARFFSAPV